MADLAPGTVLGHSWTTPPLHVAPTSPSSAGRFASKVCTLRSTSCVMHLPPMPLSECGDWCTLAKEGEIYMQVLQAVQHLLPEDLLPCGAAGSSNWLSFDAPASTSAGVRLQGGAGLQAVRNPPTGLRSVILVLPMGSRSQVGLLHMAMSHHACWSCMLYDSCPLCCSVTCWDGGAGSSRRGQ